MPRAAVVNVVAVGAVTAAAAAAAAAVAGSEVTTCTGLAVPITDAAVKLAPPATTAVPVTVPGSSCARPRPST